MTGLSPSGLRAELALDQALRHDLRAALADVLANLAAIHPAGVDPGYRPLIEGARAAAEAMARMMAGVPPATRHLEPRSFAADLARRWNARLQQAGVRMEVAVSDDLPQRIGVDCLSLERIAANLIGNAAEHGAAPGGTIRLALACEGAGQLCLTVEDGGPGYPDPARPDPAHGQATGRGLGLGVTRGLVQGMGGTLTLGNRPGGGASARVTLPFLPATIPGPHLRPGLSGLRLLVVEDSAAQRMLIRQGLTDLGADVEVAESGLAGLDLVDGGGFDLVLLDIDLPDIPGIEVLRLLNQSAQGPVPVLAVTGYSLPENLDAIRQAGARGVFPKPVTCPQALAEAILTTLAAPAPEPRAPALPETLARLMAMAGPEMAPRLAHQLGEDLRRATERLETAIGRSDMPAARAETHVLIALAGTAGDSVLHQQARRANSLAHSADRAALTDAFPALSRGVSGLLAEIARLRLTDPMP